MERRRKLTTDAEYNGYPINTGKDMNLPCDEKILNICERIVDHGLVENARILVPRFDVRLPQHYAPEGNAVIKKTMKEIVIVNDIINFT